MRAGINTQFLNAATEMNVFHISVRRAHPTNAYPITKIK